MVSNFTRSAGGISTPAPTFRSGGASSGGSTAPQPTDPAGTIRTGNFRSQPCPEGTYKQPNGGCAGGRDAQAGAGQIPWNEPCPQRVSSGGNIIDPDWCHRNAGGGPSGGISLGGMGGGAGGFPSGGGGVPAGNVPRPKLPPIDPQAPFDPELEAYRERYKGHLGNLEQGTGYAMDVMRSGQQDALEADVERARQSAAASGIPFNEAEFRSEASRGINAAMAQEKLGREAMMTQAYTQGLPIIGEPASERFNRLELDLRRDVADSESILDLYGRDIQKYGVDMAAATAANNALMSFYSQLMGGMMGSVGNVGGNLSYSNTYT